MVSELRAQMIDGSLDQPEGVQSPEYRVDQLAALGVGAADTVMVLAPQGAISMGSRRACARFTVGGIYSSPQYTHDMALAFTHVEDVACRAKSALAGQLAY